MSDIIKYTITGNNHKSSWWFEIDVHTLPPNVLAKLTGVRWYEPDGTSDNLLFTRQTQRGFNKTYFNVGLGKTLLKCNSNNINDCWSQKNSIQFCLSTKEHKCYTDEFHIKGNKDDNVVVHSSFIIPRENSSEDSESVETILNSYSVKKEALESLSKRKFDEMDDVDEIVENLPNEIEEHNKPPKKRRIATLFEIDPYAELNLSLAKTRTIILKKKEELLNALNECNRELAQIDKITNEINN